MATDQIRENALTRLEWSTRALHQPVEIQRALYPEFVAVADELATDFEHWLAVARDQAALSAFAIGRLVAIDRKLSELSASRDKSLWTLDALANAEEWATIRELAGEALGHLGWPTSPPPASPDSFIRS